MGCPGTKFLVEDFVNNLTDRIHDLIISWGQSSYLNGRIPLMFRH